MNHDDSDAFDVLPLLVCGGSLASDWASIPVSQTHGLHCHLRLSRDLLPSSFAKALWRFTDQVFRFFPECTAHWTGMTSHFVVFYVQNKTSIRMSLTSRAALCHVPVFLSAFSVSSQSFIPILAQSVVTMHCGVCFKILSNSKEHQAVSILSNRQQKVSERTLCGCYCAVRGALHLSHTETDNDVIAYLCIQMRNISCICSSSYSVVVFVETCVKCFNLTVCVCVLCQRVSWVVASPGVSGGHFVAC